MTEQDGEEFVNGEFNIKTLNGSQLILESVESYDEDGISGTISTTIEFKRM